jgi:hypothetical protein
MSLQPVFPVAAGEPGAAGDGCFKPPVIPPGASNVKDYIIQAATEFCTWVSGQRLEDISYTYWFLLLDEKHRAARALLWSAWSWMDWSPKPRAPPYSADVVAGSKISGSLYNFKRWIDCIHLAEVYSAGRSVEPSWGELFRQNDVNEFFINNEVPCRSHVLFRLWWLHD